MSTLQRAQLAPPAQLGSSAASVYDNGASTTALVTGITLFNSNTTAELVKLYFVPASAGALGTAAAANQFFEQSIAAKDTVIIEFPLGWYLTAQHDSVQGVSTNASKVTILVHGDKLA